MHNFRLMLVLLCLFGCSRSGSKDDSASVTVACGDGNSEGGSSEHGGGGHMVNYMLSGCSDGGGSDDDFVGPPAPPSGDVSDDASDDASDGQDDDVGEDAEDGQMCLTDCDHDSLTAKWKAAHAANLTGKLPPALADQVNKINQRTDLTDEQKQQMILDMAKQEAAARTSSDPAMPSGTGPDVMELMNIASYKTNFKSGVATTYTYVMRDGEKTSTTTTKSDGNATNADASARVDAGVSAETGIPGALGAVTGTNAKATADASATAGIGVEHTSKTETKTTSERNALAAPEHVTTIEVCYPNGQKYELPQTQLTGETRMATFLLAGDADHAGPAGIDHDTAPDALKKKQEEERARGAEKRAQRLAEARERELREWADRKITYYILSRDGSKWIEADTAFINSYNYLYDFFPRNLDLIEARRATATTALKSAIAAFGQRRTTIKVVIEPFIAQLESVETSTNDLLLLIQKVRDAKAIHCPERPITKERRDLELVLGEWDAQSVGFQRHAALVSELVDPAMLNKYLADREATFKPARDLVASVNEPEANLCDQFDRLQWTIALSVERRKIQDADEAAINLSSETIESLKDAAHDVILADLTAKLEVEVADLVGTISGERIKNHLTEAETVAKLLRDLLTGTFAELIDSSADLSTDEKANLKDRLQARASDEFDRLASSVEGSGARTYVYGRIRDVNAKLSRVQRRLAKLPKEQQDSLLNLWIGIATSSGPRFSPSCVTPSAVGNPECWTMSIPLDEATPSQLREFDEHLMELEQGIAKLEAFAR